MRTLMFCLLVLVSACASEPAPVVGVLPVDLGPRGDGGGDLGGMDGPDAGEIQDLGIPDQSVLPPDAEMAPTCEDRASLRTDGQLRVSGCRFSRTGEGAVTPHGVVVSEDSLSRSLRTPFHEPAQYAELGQRGFTMVWILVTWDGIEPQESLYNAAYMGRICQQATWAAEAGLDAILVMYQDRMGPAYGGHGFPAWVTPGGQVIEDDAEPTHPELLIAWDRFWMSRAEALLAAWTRLLDTCAETGGVAGIVPLANPVARAGANAVSRMDAFNTAVAGLGTDRLGPLLTLVEPLVTDEGVHWPDLSGPDTVLATGTWGPGRGPQNAVNDVVGWLMQVNTASREAGALSLMRGTLSGEAGADDTLRTLENFGVGWMHWTDAFGGESGLRDADGSPTPAMDALGQRPWPVIVSGRPLAFGQEGEGWFLNWRTDLSNQGLTRISTGSLGTMVDVRIQPEDLDTFWDYDPVLGQVQVFFQEPGIDARVEIYSVGEEE